MARCKSCSHLDRIGRSNRCLCLETRRMRWIGDQADECPRFFRREERQ